MKATVFVVEEVAEMGALEARLAALRPDVDRWATMWPPAEGVRWRWEGLLVEALERPFDYRSMAGERTYEEGLARWVGRVIDHLVVIGPPGGPDRLAGLIQLARLTSITLWLVRPGNGTHRRLARDRLATSVDEGFLQGELPTAGNHQLGESAVYRAHFLEYAAKVRNSPAPLWAEHREVATRGDAAVRLLAGERRPRRWNPRSAFAALFTGPVYPIEALARLRAFQLHAFRGHWLLEQYDYRDSYRLVALLASGHATLERDDVDLHLHALTASDVIEVKLHSTLWLP